jgi:cyanophycinase
MGKIILIGGKVDTRSNYKKKDVRPAGIRNIHLMILERLLKEMRSKKSKIEIVTSATKSHLKVGKEYKEALLKLGCSKVECMHFTTPKQADQKTFIKRLKKCDGIMFTGGDQLSISKALLDTNFLKVLKRRFSNEKKFLVSGTSAGAMAMSEVMIARGRPAESLRKGRVKLTKGLGLLPQIIIDTHFISRGRFGRLIEAVSYYPKKLGIGLGENTAVFFEKPRHVETIGTNLVVLLDGSKITFNNINKIDKNAPICVEDMSLHVLPKGHLFSITQRKIYKKVFST